MQRTDLMDTSERAHRQLVEQLRLLTPDRRFRMVMDRTEFGMQMQAEAKKRLVADLTDDRS